MFNKTIISDYLRVWTNYELFIGGGRGYDWGCRIDADSIDFGTRRDAFCSFVSEKLNEGHDVTVMLDIYISRGQYYIDNFSKRIAHDSEKEIRSKIKKYKKEQKKNPSLRDYQRSKVYDWEHRNIRGLARKRLSDGEIRELVDELILLYGCSPVSVVVTPAKKSFSTYYGWKSEIRLAEGWGRRIDVVLHEFAHHVYNSPVSHGEGFVGVLMDLYEMYLGKDREKMKNSLDEAGIKYNENWHRELE